MTSKHFLHQTYIFASPPLPISSNILALEDHRHNSCFQLRLSSFLPLQWYNLPHFMKIRKNQQCRAHSRKDKVCALTEPHVWEEAKRWRNTFQWKSGSKHQHHVFEKSPGTQKGFLQHCTWRKCSFFSQTSLLFWLSQKGNPASELWLFPSAGFLLYWCPGDREYFKLVSCVIC